MQNNIKKKEKKKRKIDNIFFFRFFIHYFPLHRDLDEREFLYKAADIPGDKQESIACQARHCSDRIQ